MYKLRGGRLHSEIAAHSEISKTNPNFDIKFGIFGKSYPRLSNGKSFGE